MSRSNSNSTQETRSSGGLFDDILKKVLEEHPLPSKPPAKGKLLNIKEWSKTVGKSNEPMLIEHLLPTSPEYGIITGTSGRGKTMLALNIGFSLATGTPFLKKFKCQKCKVGLIFLEGDEENLNKRHLKMREVYPDTEDNLCVGTVLPRSDADSVLTEIAEITKGCKVVIIDGARYMFSGDYLKPAQCCDFVVKLRNIMEQQNVSPILTLQVTKNYSKYGLMQGDLDDIRKYASKGATEFVDDATTVLLIEHTKGEKSQDSLAASSKVKAIVYLLSPIAY